MGYAHDMLIRERAKLADDKRRAEMRIGEYQRDAKHATKIVVECEQGIKDIDSVLGQLFGRKE